MNAKETSVAHKTTTCVVMYNRRKLESQILTFTSKESISSGVLNWSHPGTDSFPNGR